MLAAIIQNIISAGLAQLRALMLAAMRGDGHRRDVVSPALLAWLSFVRTSCVEWLQHRAISRAELWGLCLPALHAAIGAGDHE